MNKPTRSAVNPAEVEGAVRALQTATDSGAAVTLIDGIGMSFRCHPLVAEKLLAQGGYKRPPEGK